MLDQLFVFSPWVAYGLIAAVVLVAAELGHLIGRLWQRGHPEAASPDMLVGAALGLLALMMGFTYSLSLSRFDSRLDAVVSEANAIGTTALRARMLPEPHASEVKKLLRDYVQLRIDAARAVRSQTSLEQATARSNALQTELWQHAEAVGAADPHSIQVGLFVQTLNEMIDLQETRLAAARHRVPTAVFILLDAIAVVGIGFAGYAGGLSGRRGRVPVAIMAVMVGGVIGLVYDLDRSQSGFITVDQQAMENLKASLAR